MMTIYTCVTVVALLLGLASDKLHDVVAIRFLRHDERDERGRIKLFILSMALLGFGASGCALLFLKIFQFELESLVITIPVAVFIILGFGQRHAGCVTTR